MNRVYFSGSLKNKGRWTEEESKRFDDAYAIYGKNWKMITRAVGTRSIIQVRSHAQKTLHRLATPPSAPISSSDSQPPLNSSNGAHQQDSAGDQVAKKVESKSPSSLIPANLYGRWVFHTLEAIKTFKIIHRQNSSEEFITGLMGYNEKARNKHEEEQLENNLSK